MTAGTAADWAGPACVGTNVTGAGRTVILGGCFVWSATTRRFVARLFTFLSRALLNMPSW